MEWDFPHSYCACSGYCYIIGIVTALMVWLIGEVSESHMCVHDLVTGSQEKAVRGGAGMG